nr:MAG TPA: ERF superfamily protein [Caudoviricetes sp.]
MLKKSESIQNLSKAMAEFQKSIKQPLKDANNPFFKSQYVPLENVVEAITETGSPLGISFMQFASSDETGSIEVATLVMHSTGEYIEFPPVRMKPESNKPQAVGSAITYAKRYALSAIFGITSDKDDDGNEATGLNKQVEKQPKQQAKQQQTQEDATGKIEKYWTELEKLGVDVTEVKKYLCDKHKVGKLVDIPVSQLLGELKVIYMKKSKDKGVAKTW